MWRYSLAALILGAAMFDALLWVPAHRGDRPTREPSVSAEISRCRHARELEAAKRELEAPRSPSLWRLHYVGK